MTNEHWIPILGYEGLYEVSDFGLVRSITRSVKTKGGKQRISKGHVLRITVNSGYATVQLSRSGKTKTFKVHRLVATSFIPNPLDLPEVNHIDGNKLNNVIANLSWCTKSQNVQHAYDMGLMIPPRNRLGFCGKLNPSSKPVYQLTLAGDFIKEYESIGLTKADGFIPQHVQRCCVGKAKTHGGYLWHYK